jgi:hypothetical protein
MNEVAMSYKIEEKRNEKKKRGIGSTMPRMDAQPNTYKISNKSITRNELGNPAVLMEIPGGGDSSSANWTENRKLELLINLMYDVREMNPQDAGY